SVLAQSHGSARRYKRRRPWPSEPAIALTFPAIACGLTPSRGLSGRRLGHGSRTDRTQQSRSDRDGHVHGSGPGTRPEGVTIAGLAQATAAAPLSALIAIRSPRRRPLSRPCPP